MYVGAYEGTAHFDASLSDGRAPFFFDESFTANGSQNRVYTVTYAAPGAGATMPKLIVRYWLIAGAVGNVTLNSASLPVPLILTVEPAANGKLKLTWPQGLLLETTSLEASWTTNTNRSPFIFIPSGPKKFFRIQVH